MLITLIVCLTIINLLECGKLGEGCWKFLFDRNH